MSLTSKILYILVILVACGIAKPDNGESIYLSSRQSVNEFTQLLDSESPVHLFLSGEGFKRDWLPHISGAAAFKRVTSITISDAAIFSHELGILLTKAMQQGLIDLKLINLKRAFRIKSVKINLVGDSLRSLMVSGGDLPEDFFKMLHGYNLPNLRELSLVRCGLTEKILIPLKRSNLLTNLEYLDLSYNDLGLRVLSLFQAEVPGKLHTLKLNHTFRYSQKKTQKLKKILDKTWDVTWQGNAKMLENLKHVEMINLLPDTAVCLGFYRDSLLQQLPVFEGPIYGLMEENAKLFIDTGNGFSAGINQFSFSTGSGFNFGFGGGNQEIDKNTITLIENEVSIKQDFYRKLFKIPSNSRRLSVNFNKLSTFEYFLKSRRAAHTENLVFSGVQWTDTALRMALENMQLSSLKSVVLSNVNLTETEIFDLINDFSQLQFSIRLTKNKDTYGAYLKPDIHLWPRVGN